MIRVVLNCKKKICFIVAFCRCLKTMKLTVVVLILHKQKEFRRGKI